MARRTGRRLLALGTALGVAVLAAAVPDRVQLGPQAALAGDAKVAETLFKSGKQAHQKGDFAAAVTFFTKAIEEDPGLVEAVWWRASAQDKSGDKGAALAGYREYLALVTGKPAPTKEELRLKGLAEKSVEALAAGERELKKIDDAFVAALLQFAKDQFVRDPGVALKALGHLLAVRPDHAEAQKLREKLGGAAAEDAPAAAPATATAPAVGPFKSVKKWRDFLADRAFDSSSVSYEGGAMFVDTKGGLLFRNESSLDFGTRYACEMDFRVTNVYERGWLTGFLFASAGERDCLTVHASEGRIEILRTAGPGRPEEIDGWDMPPLAPNTWHRLGFVVDGPAVEVWWDGKKVLSWREPSGKDLAGEIGMWQQRCRTERRLFRAGKTD